MKGGVVEGPWAGTLFDFRFFRQWGYFYGPINLEVGQNVVSWAGALAVRLKQALYVMSMNYFFYHERRLFFASARRWETTRKRFA